MTDRLVVEILFEKLLQSEYQDGVVVDGFPRTSVQGECIRYLYDQMMKVKSGKKLYVFLSSLLSETKKLESMRFV